MATLSNILLDKEILLESGTNELEVLVFDVAEFRFGINVAKVREVLPVTGITSLPKAHRSIRGVFKLRNQVIPCVSLMDHLGIKSTRQDAESTMILTDLNQQQTAFLVDQVERIHRLSWENILAVPGLEALSHTPVTALARCEDRLVVMLDFEMVLDDVTEQYFRTDEVANPLGLSREEFRILLAEDSPTVREAIHETLQASGYERMEFFENGAAAWTWMEERLRQTGRADQVGDLLIADVEMPQVDGFHLTRRIKEHPELKKIPVLLYSSIITPDNRKKGAAVGADAQVSKPELAKVVQLADELIAKSRQQHRADALRDVAATAASLEPSGPSPGEQLVPGPAGDAAAAASLPVEAALPAPSEPPAGDAADAALAAVEAELAADRPTQPTAPTNVNPKLWRTFHRELLGRVAHLRTCLAEARACGPGDAVFHEVARTLHTIKSASMVVPVEPVTRCTHQVESLVEMARACRRHWPYDALDRYAQWLGTLLSPAGEVSAALAAGGPLEADLESLAAGAT